MSTKSFFLLILLAFSSLLFSQKKKDMNLFIITIDGLRWQEVFKGLDQDVMKLKSTKGNLNNLENIYPSREALMPFFWNTFAKNAAVYSNRSLNSKVEVANPYVFSYPGYSELLTGYVDKNISSNQYPENPNSNILDFLNSTKEYKDKVVAFGAWNTFGNILNAEKSSYPTFYAFKPYVNPKSSQAELINKMNQQSFKPWFKGEALDVFIHAMVMDYLETNKPKAVFISYGEPDEWAHSLNYRYYVDGIKNIDIFLEEIWNFVQNTEGYKDNTAILLTTDHGRGLLEQWGSHGGDIPNSNEIWFALYHPNIKEKGELKNTNTIYLKELAPTLSQILGKDFKAEHPVSSPIKK